MKEMLGGCLQAVGILIAGLTGLCTLLMLGGINSWRSFVDTMGAILMFAAIPIAIGVGLIFAGRALIRSGRGDRF
jgi:ABC-type proline/glycine betaine transport system permease subunit